jgi:hypothetical protein
VGTSAPSSPSPRSARRPPRRCASSSSCARPSRSRSSHAHVKGAPFSWVCFGQGLPGPAPHFSKPCVKPPCCQERRQSRLSGRVSVCLNQARQHSSCFSFVRVTSHLIPI